MTTEATSYEVEFILATALELGIRIGTNGDDLLMVAPMKVPYEVRRAFETAIEKYRKEIISIIAEENAV